ncbi:MAG TPA: hypothetical protein VKB38_00870 [Terracidiphilus sp.]|nr:hypothetical protein [Terracidiphilus sp.]
MPEFEVQESVNRCVEAFRCEHNHDEACKAFLAELPTLSGPAGFHAFLACIGKAVALGVIDLLDVGRYCHVAQIAMRAWKLAQSESEKTAHPLPPNGNLFQRRGAPGPSHLGTGEGRQTPNRPSEPPQNRHPLPPNGNLSHNEALRIAVEALPGFDMQKMIFKTLRQNGMSLPSNSHLRKNPLEALYYCSQAVPYFTDPPSAGPGIDPNPGLMPPQQQIQAA